MNMRLKSISETVLEKYLKDLEKECNNTGLLNIIDTKYYDIYKK